MLAACLIFLALRVVQVECGNLSYHEGLYIGVIAFSGYLVSLISQMKLCLLVVELLNQYKDILVEVHGLLTQFAFCHFAIALCHFYLSATLAPVQYWNPESYFHYLIVF